MVALLLFRCNSCAANVRALDPSVADWGLGPWREKSLGGQIAIGYASSSSRVLSSPAAGVIGSSRAESDRAERQPYGSAVSPFADGFGSVVSPSAGASLSLPRVGSSLGSAFRQRDPDDAWESVTLASLAPEHVRPSLIAARTFRQEAREADARERGRRSVDGGERFGVDLLALRQQRHVEEKARLDKITEMSRDECTRWAAGRSAEASAGSSLVAPASSPVAREASAGSSPVAPAYSPFADGFGSVVSPSAGASVSLPRVGSSLGSAFGQSDPDDAWESTERLAGAPTEPARFNIGSPRAGSGDAVLVESVSPDADSSYVFPD